MTDESTLRAKALLELLKSQTTEDERIRAIELHDKEVARNTAKSIARSIRDEILELEKKSKRIFSVGKTTLGDEFYYRGGKLEAYREILSIIGKRLGRSGVQHNRRQTT